MTDLPSNWREILSDVSLRAAVLTFVMVTVQNLDEYTPYDVGMIEDAAACFEGVAKLFRQIVPKLRERKRS
jgi:hypothetical protein